jgi:hypothetical protein
VGDGAMPSIVCREHNLMLTRMTLAHDGPLSRCDEIPLGTNPE